MLRMQVCADIFAGALREDNSAARDVDLAPISKSFNGFERSGEESSSWTGAFF